MKCLILVTAGFVDVNDMVDGGRVHADADADGCVFGECDQCNLMQ